MKPSLVSVVIPSFNQANFLEKTIRSIVRQDYKNIEIIVIDGDSNDGSKDIIRKYEKNLAFWESEPDSGQSEAINKGFRAASGELFAWLNSDDLLTPSAIRLAASFLTTDPDLGLIYGDRIHIDQKGNVIGINRCPPFYRAMLSRNITIPQETAFFRREFFELVGGLDEKLHFSMDFDLWCRLQKCTKFRHIPAFLGFYREHGKSKSTIASFKDIDNAGKFLDEHRMVFKRHFQADLPNAFRMKYYRLVHKMREQIYQRTVSHKLDIQQIQSIINEG